MVAIGTGALEGVGLLADQCLPLKADILERYWRVRFWPKADIRPLLNRKRHSQTRQSPTAPPMRHRSIRRIVADARCRSPARRLHPRRPGFCRRAGEALDSPAAPRLAHSRASAAAAKSGRSVDAGQGTVRAQINAVSRAAALDRRLFRRLPRWRCAAADHWSYLASHAAVA